MGRYLFAWIAMAIIAIANGALREFILEPQFPTETAYLLSTLTLIVLFAVFFWWLFRRWPTRTHQQAWAVGITWLILTIVFEAGLGLASGLTWRELLEPYDLTAGQHWLALLVFILIGPRLFHRRRGHR